MMDDEKPYPVTSEHTLLFGLIISEFARFELRIHIAAAGILDKDVGTALILLGDMNLRQKIQTLRHLNTTIGIDGKVNQNVRDALDEAKKLSKLRGLIAHATWTEGKRPGSIKPMILHLRGDKPKARGHHHNEPDYTLADFNAEAKKLVMASEKLLAVLVETGLLERVQAKYRDH